MTVKELVLEHARDRHDRYSKVGFASATKGWYAIATGKPEPSVRRAVNQLVREGLMAVADRAPYNMSGLNFFEAVYNE